jgi:prolyl 4-hydroxylase
MKFTDLRHFVRVYDSDLDPHSCDRVITAFDALRRLQRPNGRGIRAGLEDSAWTELNLSRSAGAEIVAEFRLHVDHALARYNADVGLALPIPATEFRSDLVFKRYRCGAHERFQLHFDAIHHVANRYLVMMWYLNDVDRGGETCFPQLDFVVAARKGRLLVFPPYWMYQHEGRAPESGDKYIVSTYLLFGDPAPS